VHADPLPHRHWATIPLESHHSPGPQQVVPPQHAPVVQLEQLGSGLH